MNHTQTTATSVYRYYDRSGILLCVGITGRGIRRNQEHNRDKPWWPFVASQDVEHFETRTDALTAERELIGSHRPPFNVQHNPTHSDDAARYLAARTAMDMGSGDTHRDPVAAFVRAIDGDVVTFVTGPHHATAVKRIVDLPDMLKTPIGKARRFSATGPFITFEVKVVGSKAHRVTGAIVRLKCATNNPPTYFIRSVTPTMRGDV